MAYIGVQPRLGNFQACDAITASATTTFNLLVGGTAIFPQSAQHCLVSLNGVLQAPISSYTISGSTIIFAAALTTDDSIDFITILGDTLDLGTPSDSTVTTAKLNTALLTGATDIGAAIADADLFLVDDGAGGTLRKTAASRIKTYVGGGITMADAWRTTANATFSSSGYITANWERADSDSYGGIGTGMSESSGVFTFPATGIYLVQAHLSMLLDGTRTYMGGNIEVTVNNSSYSAATELYNRGDDGHYVSVYLSFILDVSNTSNIKVKLRFEGNGSCDVLGNTNSSKTGMNFIRLGDT